jgi:propanol-preferring alcohol dehydrogenase
MLGFYGYYVRAARLHEYGRELIVEDVSKPSPEPNDVLIRVKACGVCHSDIHMIDGVIKVPGLPRVLGHEVSGEVVEVGRNAHRIGVGDRVALSFIYRACGVCRYCVEGLENICQNVLYTGFHVDGGYAEYVKAPESSVFKIPEGVSYEEAAIATDAVATAYHAVKKVAKASINEDVAVYGLGGLGLCAVQILKASGAYVIGVDVNDEKLKLAEKLGADEVINSSIEDPIRRIKSRGGVDVALDFTSSINAKEKAFESIKPHGRVVIAGIAEGRLNISPRRLVFGEMMLTGSFAFTRIDVTESLNLVSRGAVKVIYDSHPLQDINKVLKLLKEGKILFRSIVKP